MVVSPLDALVVAPDVDVPGYSRDEFGDGWASVGDGCTVRDVILARDLADETVEDGCDVTAGTLTSSYTGITSSGPATDYDIDHRVPLALAWRSGAATWSPERREQLANDPSNLVAVEDEINQSKSDQGPEDWTPPVDDCGYGRGFATVAAKYRLTVTEARKAALQRLGAACPR